MNPMDMSALLARIAELERHKTELQLDEHKQRCDANRYQRALYRIIDNPDDAVEEAKAALAGIYLGE